MTSTPVPSAASPTHCLRMTDLCPRSRARASPRPTRRLLVGAAGHELLDHVEEGLGVERLLQAAVGHLLEELAAARGEGPAGHEHEALGQTRLERARRVVDVHA